MFGLIGGKYEWTTTVLTSRSTSQSTTTTFSTSRDTTRSTSRATTTTFNTTSSVTEGPRGDNNNHWYIFGNPQRGTLRWNGGVVYNGGGTSVTVGGWTYNRGAGGALGNPSFYFVSRTQNVTTSTSRSTTTTFNTTFTTTFNTSRSTTTTFTTSFNTDRTTNFYS